VGLAGEGSVGLVSPVGSARRRFWSPQVLCLLVVWVLAPFWFLAPAAFLSSHHSLRAAGVTGCGACGACLTRRLLGCPATPLGQRDLFWL